MTQMSGGAGQLRSVDWISRILEGAAALSLFSLMAMTCIDVVGRYFFNSPLDGATEITRLMMAVVVFSVLPVASWREEHISVDLLSNVFPKGLVNSRQAILSLIAAAALGGIAYRVWILAARAREYGDTTEFLGIPTYPIIYFISALSAVTMLALALNALRYLRGQGPMSPPSP